jgi:hypothetical protein
MSFEAEQRLILGIVEPKHFYHPAVATACKQIVRTGDGINSLD